jgi:hypothetical protein
VIKMLQSLQDEQVLLNKHVHSPYDMIVREMNKRERNAGDVIEEVLRRQTFNWLPGGALAWKRLQVVSMISRTDVGILWNCSMSARDEVQVHASWDSAQLKKTEMDELLKELVDLIEQLADRESWLKRVVDLK